MEAIENPGEPTICPHCKNSVGPNSVFCEHCGKELQAEENKAPTNVLHSLAPTLLYYFSTVILLILFKLTDIFPDGFEGMAWISGLDIALILAFCFYSFEGIRKLYSLRAFKPSVAGITILGAVVGAFVVSAIANLIEITIKDDVFYNVYLFQDTGYPRLLAIGFICIQPAIFEEVAFRGFLFNNIQDFTTPHTALYVTSFLFGVIHLAVISLIWLIPIGLAFAFLRFKYNTLWYGMIGHFFYNLTVIGIEYYGIL